MLRFWLGVTKLVARIWYPVALPEDIANCFNLKVSNFLSLEDLVQVLRESQSYTPFLSRYMPRHVAESVFSCATSIESFGDKTIISFYFIGGGMEYVLHFDTEDRLRRVYLCHRALVDEREEIFLISSYIDRRLRSKKLLSV